MILKHIPFYYEVFGLVWFSHKACPTWIDIGDDQYCLSDIELNWTEAAECCRLPPNNGHLVYIESEEERDQIESFRDALNTYVNRCWIGIEDSINEGNINNPPDTHS